MQFLKENIDALGQSAKSKENLLICIISPNVSLKAMIISLDIDIAGYSCCLCASSVGSLWCKIIFLDPFVLLCFFLLLFHFIRKEYMSTECTALYCSAMYCSVLRHDETSKNPGSSCHSPAQKQILCRN